MAQLGEADKRHLASLISPEQFAAISPYFYRRQSGAEWRLFCPMHAQPGEGSPSAQINFVTNKWNCFHPSCEAHGKAQELLRHLTGQGRSNVIDINTGEKMPTDLPSINNFRSFHKTLMGNEGALNWLYNERGLDEDSLIEWGIGYNNGMPRPGSYVIPVFARDGKTIDAVRLYKRKVKSGSPKMMYWGRPGMTYLFNPAALDAYDEVVLCAGEWDCILNNQYGIPTVSHTAGEKNWRLEWSQEFAGKSVFICFDDDEAGQDGALIVARSLEGIATKVYIMHLNTGINGGDITDFYVKLGNNADDFTALMDKARDDPFSTSALPAEIPTSGIAMSLVETQNGDNMRKAIELDVMVAGKISSIYLVPRDVEATCDQRKGKVCQFCPMKRFGGKRNITITPDDERLVRFIGTGDIDSPNSGKKQILNKISGARCNDHIEYKINSEFSIEQLICSQSIQYRGNETQQPYKRTVYSIGTYNTPVNSDMHIIGKQIPGPRDSEGLLMTWKVTPNEIDIDQFQMTPELRDELAVFQVERGSQSPLEKCIEIAEDLSANVTHIYGRDYMHVAYDLVWHSAMSFDLLGRREPKGWLEALIIGDTRTGKSEVATSLAKHYHAGNVQSCEAMTFAGLVGGVQQFGKSWSVTWGAIPLNDRRLIVLDEMSGLKDRDIIERMSSIRSSGVAELQMITAEKTSARTRLVWVSNPAGTSTLTQHPGHQAITTLVKQPEDVARFDFAMAVREDEVRSESINTLDPPQVAHTYTSELCSALIMWAWSRKPEQVRWYKYADQTLIRISLEMGKRYFPEPPLVQAANIRIKLARLSVAIAARTFSTDKTGQQIIVRPEHVESAAEFLDDIYGSDAMGYLYYSERRISEMVASRKNKRQVKAWLRKRPDVYSVLESLGGHTFKPQDLDDADNEMNGRELTIFLVGQQMVRRLPNNSHRIEPALGEILRELEAD
jgi:MCM P-loop domain